MRPVTHPAINPQTASAIASLAMSGSAVRAQRRKICQRVASSGSFHASRSSGRTSVATSRFGGGGAGDDAGANRTTAAPIVAELANGGDATVAAASGESDAGGAGAAIAPLTPPPNNRCSIRSSNAASSALSFSMRGLIYHP
jgi:hypothetical protein